MRTTRFCENCGAAMSVGVSICPFCQQAIQDTLAIPPTQQRIFAPGVVVAGRYRIEARIGEGGFGVVYKARDMAKWHRLVALKQITLSALSTREQIEATDAYNREVTLSAKCYHQHLAMLYDHFTDAENWYLVLEYINGQTLEDVLAQSPDGCLPIGEVLHIGGMLCNVLGYLHSQNLPLIFRDVKPANIMLANNGKIYLIDFGIARRYQVGQSKDTGPLGSPGYAAPEQYGRAQSDQRTDIYGLGATLQTLLTGKDPLEIHAHGLPPNCEIPAELHTLILRMTDPDPNQRPASMSSVNTVLAKLQWRYPRSLAPFAWLTPLWMLFIQLIGVAFFHLSIRYLILSLTLSLTSIIIIGVVTHLAHQYKNRREPRALRRKETPKITLKGVLMMMKGSLTEATQRTRFLFGSVYFSFLTGVWFAGLSYVMIGLGGLIAIGMISMISERRSRLQKTKAAVGSQNQQQAQPMLMHQRIRNRKP